MEAQARFSEDPANKSAGYGSEQHSQTLHRQAKQNSQNPLTIAIRIGAVNQLQHEFHGSVWNFAEVESFAPGWGLKTRGSKWPSLVGLRKLDSNLYTFCFRLP